MRILIAHETEFSFEPPVRSFIQVLRLTPRNHEGQHVVSWRIDVDVDCRLVAAEDAFGNVTHTFSLEEPVQKLTLLVEGEVQSFDAAGVVRGAVERFPPELFMRPTSLTLSDDVLRKFAFDSVQGETDRLGQLHALMDAVHERIQHEPDLKDEWATTAAETLATSRGTAADLAHVFIASARSLDIPARFVSGYHQLEDAVPQKGMHAWAEAYVEGLGWIGFDAMHRICPSEAHVRVSCGLDGLGAAAVRSARIMGASETHKVHLRTAGSQASQQRQA
jgi:transglutaminase-like putative cysteine protease